MPKEMHIAAMQNKNAANNVIKLTFCLLISVNMISFHKYWKVLESSRLYCRKAGRPCRAAAAPLKSFLAQNTRGSSRDPSA